MHCNIHNVNTILYSITAYNTSTVSINYAKNLFTLDDDRIDDEKAFDESLYTFFSYK